MRIVGIDPGGTGGIVLLDSIEKTAEYTMIPYRADKLMDYKRIRQMFKNFDGVRMIYLEKVTGRGGWHSKSTFQFGSYYGQAGGLIQDYPYMLISPQTWQKIAWQGEPSAEPKAMSAASFQRMNPSTRMMKKENGIIDAFHLARYGMINHQEKFTDDWNFINLAK